MKIELWATAALSTCGNTEANVTLAEKAIGYSPTVDFDTGLHLTIEAMRRNFDSE